MTPARRRLLYRAMHRGFKEADLIVGHFAQEHLPKMSDAELDEFSALLEVPDQELYAWIIGRADVPDNYNTPVFRQMQAFNLSDILTAS